MSLIDSNFGFEFVSAKPEEARIENNIAVRCKTPFTWSDVHEGKPLVLMDKK